MSLPLLAGALAVLPFARSVRHSFVSWDDPAMVLTNPLLTLPWSEALVAVFTSFHMTSWQPLGWLLYKALLSLGAGAAWPFHVASLLLHGLNAALTLAVLRELFPKARPAALLAAVLLWAWHPIHAESVAWASQLSDLLCGSFVLAALLAHLRGSRGPAWTWAALAGLCRWKALAAPVLALALDLARGVKPRDLLRRHAGFWAVAAAVAGLNAAAKGSMGYAAILRPHEAAVGLLFQARKLLWPLDLAPTALLDGADNPWKLGLWGAALLLAAAAGLLAAASRRRRALAWSAAAFALLLAPTLLVASPGPVAVMDHHLYLASLAFVPLVAAALDGRRPYAGAAVAAGLFVFTVIQTGYWRDSESLFTRTLAVDPLSQSARLNLAAARAEAGDFPAALVSVDEQLGVFPRDPLARRLRAEILTRSGVSPARLESDAAGWLFERGRVPEASARMDRALSLSPREPGLLVNAAIIDGAAGRRARARERLVLALKLAPRDAAAAEALRRLDAAERR